MRIGEIDMPVYEPKDYKKVIARIQRKISELNIEMSECLTEEEIMSFEGRHNVKLPQAYRVFLQRVGNGCKRMLDGRRLNDLESCPQQELSKPFLLDCYRQLSGGNLEFYRCWRPALL